MISLGGVRASAAEKTACRQASKCEEHVASGNRKCPVQLRVWDQGAVCQGGGDAVRRGRQRGGWVSEDLPGPGLAGERLPGLTQGRRIRPVFRKEPSGGGTEGRAGTLPEGGRPAGLIEGCRRGHRRE